ncbi:hypothetical protein ACS0TY_022684 [Phlomoides rotata]
MEPPALSSARSQTISTTCTPTSTLAWLRRKLLPFNLVADNHYRPDLKKAALARLSVVHRSLKVAKSGVKKNRQA